MNSIGTLWVFGMMLIICADIFSRNVLNHPLNGVPEIIAFSIAGTIYLQLANTLNAGRFTRAELLIDWLELKRPFAGRIFNAIFNLFGIVVFLIMIQGFWAEFSDAWAENEIAGVPGVITFIVWPFYLILLIGAVATGIEFLLRFIREVAGAGVFQVGNRLAQTVGDDAELWAVALALDVPELQQIEEVVKRHAVEIIRIQPLLDVP